MPVTIRPFARSDSAGVERLWQAVFPHDPPWNDPRAVLRAKRGEHDELFFVALERGVVLGTALGGYDGHRGWVYKVAVDTGRRREGIATALMGRLEQALESLGCAKLNLQVRASNDATVGFYEALGYTVEPRVSLGKRLGADLCEIDGR